jgi:hypothetical protein
MGDFDAIGALYEKITRTWGRLDILVNNLKKTDMV